MHQFSGAVKRLHIKYDLRLYHEIINLISPIRLRYFQHVLLHLRDRTQTNKLVYAARYQTTFKLIKK